MSIVYWPYQTLPAYAVAPNPSAFSRGGGRSLGGIERKVRTDRGFWNIQLTNIPVASKEQRRTWSAIRTALGGAAGLIAIPVWSYGSAPYVSGEREPIIVTPHDDDTLLDDGTGYEQGAISITMAEAVAIGATVVKLRIVNAMPDLVGIRFSYNHALYETGPASDVTGDVWTVPIVPQIRAAIPLGAELECDMPTCLVHLADDKAMDIDFDVSEFAQGSVSFVEAVDYWSDLAVAP
ncbi:hypothetical protein OHD62_17300 [Mesorhizobium sp. YC-39]|uniref:hypothetical protein n=1 Tax=unclassified Mesorhizobium TaxID=325217 RepID=UPI0021E884AA|nr:MULTISPECIES: hypothetical protein [unclassified Mesorhizobium]MCV3209600.1 hypothetical protein [Mesorhizobium sp. YC-2]MCV3230130.1 hypothetical protein [Mesorhizobium sp. YC-39]